MGLNSQQVSVGQMASLMLKVSGENQKKSAVFVVYSSKEKRGANTSPQDNFRWENAIDVRMEFTPSSLKSHPYVFTSSKQTPLILALPANDPVINH